MSITFYDLERTRNTKVGNPWSPNTWKTRFLLNIKGLDYKTTYLHFLDIPETIGNLVPDIPRATVPCITDVNGETIQDSRKIALYLEEKYPTPSVFHGGSGLHFFFDDWAMQNIVMLPFRISLMKMFYELDPEAQEYYRKSREEMVGMTLEEYAGDKEENIKAINKELALVSKTLAKYKFLTGDQVGWADISLASYIIMLEKFHPDIFYDGIINPEPHLKAWWERMQQYADFSQ